MNSTAIPAKTLTKRQVASILKRENITAELRGAGKNWEIELVGKAVKQFEKFVLAGGFKTGYGAWILSPGYVAAGDWNDKSSIWHY